MKEKIILIFFILEIAPVLANSIGITPAYYIDNFEESFEKIYEFKIYTGNEDSLAKISLIGDLSNYASLDKDIAKNAEVIKVKLKLPKQIEKPGKHKILIEARIISKNNDSMFNTLPAIRASIDIIVPYPGKYIETDLKLPDISQGESCEFEATITNLGSEDINIIPKIEVYSKNEKIIEKNYNEQVLKTKKKITIKDKLQTEELKAGDYEARLLVNYDEKNTSITKKFKIGQFLIEIIDYDYEFELGRINPFRIKLENKWNSNIKNIYAEIIISDEKGEKLRFKTSTIDLEPWQTKNITGYLDLTDGFEEKKYTAKIDIYYENSYTTKLAAIYIKKPKKTINYLYITIPAIIIVAIILILLLKMKNEKKKK